MALENDATFASQARVPDGAFVTKRDAEGSARTRLEAHRPGRFTPCRKQDCNRGCAAAAGQGLSLDSPFVGPVAPAAIRASGDEVHVETLQKARVGPQR